MHQTIIYVTVRKIVNLKDSVMVFWVILSMTIQNYPSFEVNLEVHVVIY